MLLVILCGSPSALQLFFLQGDLFKAVHADDSVWTIEDGCLLDIVLSKSDTFKQDEIWESLLNDDRFKPDPLTFHEMRKKLDLERFQLEVRYYS